MDSKVRVLPDDAGLRAAVAELHERSFPARTVSGRQLVEGSRGHCVVVVIGASGLIGYAAGYPQEGELYVDFVAVDPNLRSLGAGRALVRGLLRELAARHGARSQAAAVIALGNDASERMFTQLGFTLAIELVSYRHQRGAYGSEGGPEVRSKNRATTAPTGGSTANSATQALALNPTQLEDVDRPGGDDGNGGEGH